MNTFADEQETIDRTKAAIYKLKKALIQSKSKDAFEATVGKSNEIFYSLLVGKYIGWVIGDLEDKYSAFRQVEKEMKDTDLLVIADIQEKIKKE